MIQSIESAIRTGEKVHFSNCPCGGDMARAPVVCFGVCLKSVKSYFIPSPFPQNNISMKFWCFMLLNLASFYNVAFNPIAKNVILDSEGFLSLPVSFYD